MIDATKALLEREVEILRPPKLKFGNGTAPQCVRDFVGRGCQRVFVVLSLSVKPHVASLLNELESRIEAICLYTEIDREPTIGMLGETLDAAREFEADAVLGIGGGSVLDAAKLVAALLDGEQQVKEVLGIGNLSGRLTFMVCLPTTAGTGSEVSPNAILLDEEENLKKGAVSPHLVSDATYVDPELTKTVPPDVTAATGLDALTHCIEAYANRFAHPMVDLYALEGVRLIGANLERAVDDGNDTEARTKVALGSMYGGLCLGPVNTAAVHALSYPLGSEFHLPHGISNAVLLPFVLEYNFEAAPERHAEIAEALGVQGRESTLEKAEAGVEKIRQLMKRCDVPLSMEALGVPKSAIKPMAESAVSIDRLLKNNVRELSREDAVKIYEAAF
ncbi:iron-containing alcohol dehydrogenase [Aliifodinibius sp. S!AR15-10]|uniref:iron-containing alcohol dehydrogenase n=1 Tax=Aliifodinibius sp. S!AR15-10 TaxID=2950437 RepID=UPI002862D54E|nr:iron-containing alcohol dehydrogenase [Aliifodinibius sp. S!AR15-10]MDR8391938.1 iron-containing alcohol dehydrogenase [Aliifodinibius sp. S!AR15-10]